MKESVIEKRLRIGVETELGGLCEKFTTGRRGPPDRLCTLPPPVGMQLVELKQESGEVEAPQVRDHKRRAKLGVKVHVTWSLEDVEDLLRRWRIAIETHTRR